MDVKAWPRAVIHYLSFNLIIDDVVLPDGRTHMATLGGSGVYGAAGMRVWSEAVGLVAKVGTDCDPRIFTALDRLGIDRQGVTTTAYATPRAWQLFEADGRRTEVPRAIPDAWYYNLHFSLRDVPDAYRAARGWHMAERQARLLAAARELTQSHRLAVGLEPFLQAEPVQNRAEFLAPLPDIAVFSPSYDEARALFPDLTPVQVLAQFATLGARLVALRMGAQGSLVQATDTGEIWHIPAYPVPVVDHTGAGNAYTAALLVGWCETGDPLQAGLMAAVAASFMLEQFGPPATPPARSEAERRLAQLQRRVKPLALAQG
jgi:sugar/nucleoside kinase (ribokinase family)